MDGQRKSWYEQAIPHAEELYGVYLNGRAMSSFSKWDREGYRRRVGEEEAARRRRSIMAEQWGYQHVEERKRLGFTQAGLAEIMGGGPGRVSQIEHGEVATGEALAAYLSAMGGKLGAAGGN